MSRGKRNPKWTDKDGKDNYTTEIVIRPYVGDIKTLDPRKEGEPECEQLSPVGASGLDDEKSPTRQSTPGGRRREPSPLPHQSRRKGNPMNNFTPAPVAEPSP